MTGFLPDGTDADHYARLEGIDRAGLMWEWLRRSTYARWYNEAERLGRITDRTVADWGLHFR